MAEEKQYRNRRRPAREVWETLVYTTGRDFKVFLGGGGAKNKITAVKTVLLPVAHA